ncbi:hypothetical protein CGMCC3_g9340 [Colletotrichum fructicola]|nr:uncharacterized protein CGMCC3_g9340 [Colletotrichum fructicola]KAE9574605.1 hypothetical protein CGMCC3_g9340 [Colletotrichum fructicola]
MPLYVLMSTLILKAGASKATLELPERWPDPRQHIHLTTNQVTNHSPVIS